ncbi:universal stress protein [Desulfobacter postgatei]|uniref:Universal stress protein UspA-like protein n=1 Tax=Desulfobacter postgatei 2ac9 TaxID=879212 RepID=I5B7P4_9BACT|nr:universal stress protein [Desulfobacter postgatei]EIM65507.1 universal stress protein UspA-like protein [Desulfobacter postgatei 2ac9]
MKTFKNILYVGEDTADQVSAVARAVSMAENNQARLTVIDVIAPVPEPHLSGTVQHHMQKLDSLVGPYRNRLTIKIDVLAGTTFLEVIRSVLRNAYDLVIKAAEDPDFIKRLFGSDDMHLLRKCPCPVWLMKLPEKTNYKCVLAAVDFDPLQFHASEQAFNTEIIDRAAALALSDTAFLHIVHAWEAFAEKAMLAHGDISIESVTAHVQKQQLIHQKELHRLGEALRNRIGADGYSKISPSFHLPKGPTKKVIPPLAAGLGADLVVMGTVARTGISGLIIGNTAEAILDQLTCSVLAIKPSGFKTPVKLDE